jgi:hypothetical protein
MLKFLAVSAVTLAFSQPTTLTLACKGTTTAYDDTATPEPLSLSLLVDFTNKIVKGFPFPSNVTITQVTELAIYFHNSIAASVFDGRMDRVTGNVEGHSALYKSTAATEMMKPGNVLGGYNFSLKCIPAKQKF